jgi:hypothetical protein
MMILEATPTAEPDLGSVLSLMHAAFGQDDPAASVDLRLLRWKYLDPGGTRGFAFHEDGRLVAHCGTAPVSFLLPGGGADGVCFVDWFRARGRRGAGTALMRELMARSGVSIAAGGTPASRTALARMEFAPGGTLVYYLRSVRPWRRFLAQRPSPGAWRTPARLLRDLVWSLSPSVRPEAGWEAVPTPRFGPEDCVNRPATAFTLTRREPEALNHWLRCPRGAFTGFLVTQHGRLRGHFLINRSGHEARIADLRVDGESPEAWRTAYALAAAAAAEHEDVHVVTAIASAPIAEEALRAEGFHAWGRAEISLYDPGGAMAGHAPIHWNPVDDDWAIL